jgi:hypothetical protein
MKKQTNILVVSRRREQGRVMNQMKTAQLVVVFGMGLTLMSCGQGGDGPSNSALAQQGTGTAFVAPTVFQAAGPTVASIQNTVDQYRTALGATNNGNTPGPLPKDSGHREINWDGGGNVDTTTAPVTPFNTFLNTRGAQFTTPGTGLSQAPPFGRTPGRPGYALQQSDLRHHLQYLQPFAAVHPSGQQHHRGAVLRTWLQWNCAGKGQWLRRGLHGR